jgi:hypothetical protein
MNLKLIWTNINTVSVTINIYRSDTPIDPAALPAPVGTITDGSTNWTDPTAVRGRYYYYMFETTSANDRVVSINYRLQAVPRLGPGPSELKYGDYNYGYFGSVASNDFINTANLRNAVNFQFGLGTTVSPTWHKYVRNGKVYFVPNTALGQTVTWTQIYSAGIMFGVSGPGNHQNGATPTDQRKTVVIGPDTFIVRCMKGYSDDVTRLVPNAAATEPAEYPNEWNDFIYPIIKYVPTAQRIVNVASQDAVTSFPGPQNGYTGMAIQEQSDHASLKVVRRGQAGETRASVTARSCNTDAYYCSWWPVLELVAPAI